MEPLDRFREIAKDQVKELKASPELKQATLARIRLEGQKSRKPKRWVWPALSSSAAALALVLFLNSGAFDLDSGSRPGISQGIDDPNPPNIAGEPPDSGISILTDPDSSLFSDNEDGVEPDTGTYLIKGEPVPLPSYVPAGFQLQNTVVDESEERMEIQYVSLEEAAVFSLIIEKHDGLETISSPTILSTEPLTARWEHGPWQYTLTGQLTADEAGAIAGSLTLKPGHETE